MAGEPTVIGTSVQVGFPSGETVTGIIRASYDKTPTADIEYVRDENNNEATAVVSNLGMRIVLEGTLSAANTTAKGSTVTVNSVKYIVEDIVRRHTAGSTRASMTLYKPAQMTIA
jgi:hypothetical protein